MTRYKLLQAFFIGIIFICGCAKTPYTGRNQLMILSSGEEKIMGVQATHEILEKEPVETHTKFSQTVNTIGRRIANVIPHSSYDWHFYTINDDTPNAFALPGGAVFVYRGILQVAKTEEQLAAIMGHEIAHILARHGSERMSQQIFLQLGGEMGKAAVGMATKGAYTDLFGQVYGIGTTVGILLPFSREHEYEADHIGVFLMAEAGYDPREAIVLWENFSLLGKSTSTPEFLSTHPIDINRIKALQKVMPEAIARFKKTCGKPGATPLGIQ